MKLNANLNEARHPKCTGNVDALGALAAVLASARGDLETAHDLFLRWPTPYTLHLTCLNVILTT